MIDPNTVIDEFNTVLQSKEITVKDVDKIKNEIDQRFFDMKKEVSS